jgi:hypothetical protein
MLNAKPPSTLTYYCDVAQTLQIPGTINPTKEIVTKCPPPEPEITYEKKKKKSKKKNKNKKDKKRKRKKSGVSSSNSSEISQDNYKRCKLEGGRKYLDEKNWVLDKISDDDCKIISVSTFHSSP